MPESRTYVKRPVEVQAMRYVGDESAQAIAKWAGTTVVLVRASGEILGIDIATMEGTMRASLGDWVVRGVKGEFYPVKPDVFALTYYSQDEYFRRTAENEHLLRMSNPVPDAGDNTKILARDYRDYCERQHDDASRLAHTSDEPLWYSALVWEARARAMDAFLAWLDADDE